MNRGRCFTAAKSERYKTAETVFHEASVHSPGSINHQGSYASYKHCWSHQRIVAMAVKLQYDLEESNQAVEVCQSDLHMFQSLFTVIKHVTSLHSANGFGKSEYMS